MRVGIVEAIAVTWLGTCAVHDLRKREVPDWLTLPALALALALPAAWVLGEWLRGWILTGFPWLSLGYGQIDGPLAAWAPVSGVYGVSWVAAVVAGVLVTLVTGPNRDRAWAAVLAAVVAAVAVPKDSDMPGPGHPSPARREAVDRQQDGNLPLCQDLIERLGNRRMIGSMKPGNSPLPLPLVDLRIARNDRTIGNLHDESRIVDSPVGIDQQTGKPGEEGPRPQPGRKLPGHGFGADIIGDVPN